MHSMNMFVQDVPNGRAVVEKEIGERLPDPQAVRDGGRHQAKGQDEPVVGGDSRESSEEDFKKEDTDVGDQQPLDRGREEKIEAER